MTMLPHLETNLATLRRMGQPVAQWLELQNVDREEVERRIGKNEGGLLDWQMENGKQLFASLPPSVLYRDWLPDERAATSATVIVGANLGYGLNHVIMKTPVSHKVLVIEPDPKVLMACLGQTDYTPVFENRKLMFLPPDTDYFAAVVQHLDLQFVYGKVYLRGDVPMQQASAEYAKWVNICRARLENFSVELVTLRHRQEIMVGNELKNFRKAMGTGSLNSMKDSAEGLSAVLLGAGPSLAEFAPKLAKRRGNALYATSLQTVPVLQEHGLKPDFCMAIDFNDHLLKLFNRLDMEWARDIPLIYSTKVDPRVVELYPGPTIPLWTLGGMATYVLQQKELVLDAGGNVSLTINRFLRWCGVSQITLVGQDFAWKGEQTHAEGHHNRRATSFNPRLHQKLRNRYDEEIITSHQYIASMRELEDDLRKAPFTTLNLYGGGIDIKGTKAVDLDEARLAGSFASAPGSVEKFNAQLLGCRNVIRNFHFEPMSPVWTANLNRAGRKLEKLFKKLEKNQGEIHRIMEHVSLFIKQDPLYLPYLFNETLDLAGLTRAKYSYEPGDLGAYKKIIRKVLKKVREVDRCLALPELRKNAA